MMASGFAGLGYQIVWTQQCALWLGHESAAVLAVVAAFFGGIAVGAFALGGPLTKSARPVGWYAACELVIAMWSLLLALTMSPVSGWMLRVTGVQPSPMWQWTVAFCGAFLMLLPATAAMGATLPAMDRVTAGVRGPVRAIASLYASNTFGAVIGVLAIAFWLAPELGLLRTAGVCITLNVLCALAALAMFARAPIALRAATPNAAVSLEAAGNMKPPLDVARSVSAQRGDDCAQAARSMPIAAARPAPATLARLAATGFLGIGYEVLVVRVLSQVDEDTVYTFAMLLAVYLIGSAVGAAAYQRWLVTRDRDGKLADDRLTHGTLTDRLLCALATACLIGTATLWADEHLKAAALNLFGPSMSAAISAETLLAVIAFGPPTIVMGALFSHLASHATASGISFGKALGVNTLGAAAAPLVFGVLAFPLLGPKLSLLILCAGYLTLIPWKAWRAPAAWIPASATLALAIGAPRLAFIDIPDGGHVVSYQDGVMAAVSVVEDADGVSRLRIDNRQQEGSSVTLRVDARQAWLPLLLHPAPKRALFLGLGTGVTASSAAEDPTLQVDAVELLPEVIAASDLFTRRVSNRTPNPRLHLLAADARRYVRASDTHYDVIISDNFHPARSGSGSLYTVEHFTAVRERLAEQGVFCQWLPLHQLDLETFRSIVQSFIAVFPRGSAIVASNSLETPVIGLIGRHDDGHFDAAALRARLAHAALPRQLTALAIEDEFALLGSFIAGPESLKKFAGNAPANTDDHPVVAYLAPRVTYSPDSLPRDRLIALLNDLTVAPSEIFTPSTDEAWQRRLAAYWSARNRFIVFGRDVHPSPDVQVMLDQVREPLLSVLRISPDFRPAYDPLVLMASALSHTDVTRGRGLLLQLAQLQPARPEARLALAQLGTDAR
jgi:spermidine synthase